MHEDNLSLQSRDGNVSPATHFSSDAAKGRNKRRLAQTAATPEQEEYEVKRIWDEREVKRRKGKSY